MSRKMIYQEGYKSPYLSLPVDGCVEAINEKAPDKISLIKKGVIKIDGKAYVFEHIEMLYRDESLDD